MSKTCGKDVYSNLNFKAQREDNMKKIEKVYNDLLGQYSSYYSEYLKAQRDAIGNPGDATAQNQMDRLTAQKRPMIKQLNQQIIDIENEILKNNKEIRKSIEEQNGAIELDLKEKATIEAKIRAIEKNLQQAEDGAYTGTQAITQYPNMHYEGLNLERISGSLFSGVNTRMAPPFLEIQIATATDLTMTCYAFAMSDVILKIDPATKTLEVLI
jgi:hypothetical protein